MGRKPYPPSHIYQLLGNEVVEDVNILKRVINSIVDIDIDIYPKALIANASRGYKERDEYQNGWNAALMWHVKKINKVLKQNGITIINNKVIVKEKQVKLIDSKVMVNEIGAIKYERVLTNSFMELTDEYDDKIQVRKDIIYLMDEDLEQYLIDKGCKTRVYFSLPCYHDGYCVKETVQEIMDKIKE